MLALVYLSAAAFGAVALNRWYGFEIVMAGVLASVAGLAMIQIHMMLARSGGADLEKSLFDLKSELRKLTTRIAQTEARAEELKQTFEKESATRREVAARFSQWPKDMEKLPADSRLQPASPPSASSNRTLLEYAGGLEVARLDDRERRRVDVLAVLCKSEIYSPFRASVRRMMRARTALSRRYSARRGSRFFSWRSARLPVCPDSSTVSSTVN